MASDQGRDFEGERTWLRGRVSELEQLVDAQADLIKSLSSQVDDLAGRLGQDSSNSSVPPSSDKIDRRERRAKERAERKAKRRETSGADDKAERKPGKQPGAPGATLCRREPQHRVVHSPQSCRSCGEPLGPSPVTAIAKFPPVELSRCPALHRSQDFRAAGQRKL